MTYFVIFFINIFMKIKLIVFSKFEFPNLLLGGCQSNLRGWKFGLQLRMPKSFLFKRYDDFLDFYGNFQKTQITNNSLK